MNMFAREIIIIKKFKNTSVSIDIWDYFFYCLNMHARDMYLLCREM